MSKKQIVLDKNGEAYSGKKSFIDGGSYGGGGLSMSSQKLLNKPYETHAIVNACGRTISRNVSQLPKAVVNIDDPENYIFNHAILKSFQKPNTLMPSSTVFLQAIVLGLLLPTNNQTGGQVFCIPLKSDGSKVNLAKGEFPDNWYPFNDQFITPTKVRGVHTGWKYDPLDSESKRLVFTNDEIVRIHFYNPYDWTKGLSSLTPALHALIQDVESTVYNYNFFKNNAVVSGLLSSDEDMTEGQYKETLKRWYENYGGGEKSNRIAVLGMGLKYQQFGQTHVDMQFVEQKHYTKSEILASFGLNKIAIGDYESINFATIKEGRKMLWEDTYKPIDLQIVQAFNDQWIRNVDRGALMMVSDYSGVEALRRDYTKAASAAKAMIESMELPAVEAARITNIPITESMVKKYPWLGERPVKKTGLVLPEPQKSIVTDVIHKNYTDKSYMLSTKQKQQVSTDYIDKVLMPGEKKLQKKLDRFFNSQRNRMQDNVDEWLKKQDKTLKEYPNLEHIIKQIDMDLTGILLNKTAEDEALIKLMSPVVLEQMKTEELRLVYELDELISFGVDDGMRNKYVKQRTKIYKTIDTTTFNAANEDIKTAIKTAIKDNLTPKETAKLVKTAISDVMSTRKNASLTIARTEIGSISSTTRQVAFRKEGIEKQEWLTAKDEMVRDQPGNNHKDADGQVVKIGDVFPYAELRYPHDPKGRAEQIINCRCVAIAVSND